ncbi:fumarylacetoacetate hydrolase family protein [Acidicapsa ligni]|uniref:fumarylacetoacetate hydrolase family protein n=1 Tax=Acidicapsa ligni TaxID=542300 RepID=UPI0021E04A9D|nr:fumarylacetoacetate hydrolase family protein [Acidicapsa ligni]
MKYCRFETENGPQLGQVEQRNGEFWIVANLSAMLIQNDDETLAPFEAIKMSEVNLLPPVTPTKIICVGRNYRDHAKELGNEVPAEPLLFFKPLSSLLPPGGVIRMPKVSERVDFEGELAVVIAKRAYKLRASDDRNQYDLNEYIHGYTLANDVTARDLQKKDGQWTRAKGFDTFCPVGPIVDTDLKINSELTIETRVNGELRQHGSTADFIFSLPALLEYITAAITLEPGDLLLTGTPAGVGPLVSGDVVEVSIPGLGILSNSVQPDEN